MSDEVETALSPVQRLVLRLEGGGLCCAATRQYGQEKKRGREFYGRPKYLVDPKRSSIAFPCQHAPPLTLI
jgi:hypothetical protein